MFTTHNLNFSVCSQANGSSNTWGILADRLLLMGVNTSCTSHISSKVKSEALSRSTPLALFRTLWHLESMKRGACQYNPARGYKIKKDFLLSSLGKPFLPVLNDPCGDGKTVFISRWIKSVENVLNAHKESFAQSQWTPPLADKRVPSLLSTGGHIIAWLSRLPWVLAIHSDQKQPSLGILKPSDINHSDILLDRQWNNKQRRIHSWNVYSESSPGLLSRRVGCGGVEVRVLSGSCGNHEDWIETLTYEETCGWAEENVIFKALCDGFW